MVKWFSFKNAFSSKIHNRLVGDGVFGRLWGDDSEEEGTVSVGRKRRASPVARNHRLDVETGACPRGCVLAVLAVLAVQVDFEHCISF